MITAIELENFRCFKNRVRIPIRPVTVLCGKNSTGKSSVLQALLYAFEVFVKENLDPDWTAFGGESVDLGGFKHLVYGHDLGREIRLRIECDRFDAHNRGRGNMECIPSKPLRHNAFRHIAIGEKHDLFGHSDRFHPVFRETAEQLLHLGGGASGLLEGQGGDHGRAPSGAKRFPKRSSVLLELHVEVATENRGIEVSR